MKKLLVILLCFPMFGFGQENPSDSAISFDHFVNGMVNVEILKDTGTAITDFNKAISTAIRANVYSNDIEASKALSRYYLARANAYSILKKWKLAIDDYNSQFEYRSKYWYLRAEDYFNRGTAYMMNKEYDLAIADYNLGLDLNFEIHYLRYRAYCYFVKSDYNNAILDLNVLIDDYQKTELLEWRAKSYFYINKYHSTISDCDDILKESENIESIFLKGLAYGMLNSPELACINFKNACDLGLQEACNLSTKKDGVCFPKKIEQSTYKPKNIRNFNKIVLPIIVEGNMNFIMVTIGNKSYKYLIDTGASDMIINSDIEGELINLGYLKSSDYRQPRIYEIANGEQIKLKIANLSHIKIANNRFDNIDIAIGDQNASLLLGMSFINRFDWKITNNTLELMSK